MKPDIAIYIPSLKGGGAERVMVILANEFTEQGFRVDLVLASATGSYLTEVNSRVNIVDLGKSRVIKSLPGLIRYLRDHQPASLLSAMGHANLVALLAKKLSLSNTRIVVSERNDTSIEKDQQKNFRSVVIHCINKYLYRTADEIHAVSRGVAVSLANHLNIPIEKIKVIYNPVYTIKILELAQVQVNLPWLRKNGQHLIVAAGRLTKQKDFSTLVRAFALIHNKIDARLVIMGEGELRADLELLIVEHGLQEKIILPGFVDNPFAIMKHADLFVLSSAWEGLPNVLIQAMACGTPVVSTDCPSGPAEILENGKWGRLVQVGNIEALARAITETLSQKENPDVLTRASHFNLERAVEQYLKILLPDARL